MTTIFRLGMRPTPTFFAAIVSATVTATSLAITLPLLGFLAEMSVRLHLDFAGQPHPGSPPLLSRQIHQPTVAHGFRWTCTGPYKGTQLRGGQFEGNLALVIEHHFEWLHTYAPEARGEYDAQRDPRRADLCGAILSGSDFIADDMSWATFAGAELRHVDFRAATLVGADFSDANLRDSNFLGADASRAHFNGADLRGALIEFQPGKSPDGGSIWAARNLEWLTYKISPVSLVEIREAFKKIGRRDLERRITFAIEHTTTHHALSDGRWLEAAFRYVAWELPTRYDLAPERALKVLLLLVAVFAIPYWYALNPHSLRYVWRKLPGERVGGDGKTLYEAVTASGLRRWGAALQFSILSAFNLGWHDLSIGNWLARLQAREYSLVAEGWPRMVAGAQSLVSTYLLAMWALTYFGRLFEG